MVDAIFLGDSWIDDFWNTHKTWATLVSESENWSHVNLSKAGTTTQDVLHTLSLVKNINVSSNTHWVLHTGGNDLLYWVIKHPSYVTYDIWRREKHFFKSKGKDIALQISRIVEYIISHFGATKITITSNTACYGIPLCRAFGIFYTPFTTKQHMDMITSEVNIALLKVIQDMQHLYPHVHFSFYNECKACTIHHKKLFWKWDLFHPKEQSHSTLATSFLQDIKIPLHEHMSYFTTIRDSTRIPSYFFSFTFSYVFLLFASSFFLKI